MQDAIVKAYLAATSWQSDAIDGVRSERGEGIVSVAIAVLIMAALGVVAYGAFDALFSNTTDAAEGQISQIGG
jgi:hypothetical protein